MIREQFKKLIKKAWEEHTNNIYNNKPGLTADYFRLLQLRGREHFDLEIEELSKSIVKTKKEFQKDLDISDLEDLE